MDALTAFGLFAVSAMLIFYALEPRGRLCILGFAGACALGSAYGFLQGAWPFGAAYGRWWRCGGFLPPRAQRSDTCGSTTPACCAKNG